MSDFQKYLDQALQKIDIAEKDGNNIVRAFDYDVFREISSQIIRIRNETGLTQKQLAQRTGLTQALISRIENGSSHPTIETLKKIADGLGHRLTIVFDEFEEDELEND
ncbi:MAG: helix-turn-helix transcriptional regulator [Victivallales bacterium]|nr:helix-turn-helix transcriptional regulator [Victivallales bacterium]